MFIAVREIKADGKTYLPGEVVPSAKNWDFHALRATLNLGWLKEVPDEDSNEPEPSPTEPEQGELNCPRCSRKGFKSKRGLSLHLSKHK